MNSEQVQYHLSSYESEHVLWIESGWWTDEHCRVMFNMHLGIESTVLLCFSGSHYTVVIGKPPTRTNSKDDHHELEPPS